MKYKDSTRLFLLFKDEIYPNFLMWRFIISQPPTSLNVTSIVRMFLVGNSINMLLLKLASLFDKNSKTLSIYYFLKEGRVSENQKKDIEYIIKTNQDLISRIIAIRSNLIGHHNVDFFYDIENVELNKVFNFTFIEMEIFIEFCKKIVEILQDDSEAYQMKDYEKENYKKIYLEDVEEEMQGFFKTMI